MPFKRYYDEDFKEETFYAIASVDGQKQFEEWRRSASRQAIAFDLKAANDAIAAAQALDECNRRDMLKMTGTGFQNWRRIWSRR